MDVLLKLLQLLVLPALSGTELALSSGGRLTLLRARTFGGGNLGGMLLLTVFADDSGDPLSDCDADEIELSAIFKCVIIQYNVRRFPQRGSDIYRKLYKQRMELDLELLSGFLCSLH